MADTGAGKRRRKELTKEQKQKGIKGNSDRARAKRRVRISRLAVG